MKYFFLLILFIAIACQPSLLISREERIKRQKEMKEKFIKCLKENGSNEFINFINENEANLRYAIAKNKNQISTNDKLVIRDCKRKLERRTD